jgi:hypothetical protein
LQKAADHHEETMTQVEGLYAKLDDLSAAWGAFLRALETGKAPPRPPGQSDCERLKILRALKRQADNEIRELVHAEKKRKTQEVVALTSEVTKQRLDQMDPAAGLKALDDYQANVAATMKAERARLKARARDDDKRAKKAKKDEEQVPGDGHGGSVIGNAPCPAFRVKLTGRTWEASEWHSVRGHAASVRCAVLVLPGPGRELHMRCAAGRIADF